MSSTVLFSFRSWWPIFLALLLVSGPLCASAEGDCFTSDGKEVKLSAKCTKANTTIKFSDKDKALNFKLEASQGDSIPLIRITLNIGGCEFHGDVSYGGVRNSLQLDKTANPDLPAHAKATSSGVTFSNPTYNVPDCTPKFVADGDGNLVNISYKADGLNTPIPTTFRATRNSTSLQKRRSIGALVDGVCGRLLPLLLLSFL
ncbi:hypothetical protein M3Y94_01075000 [Aphelenchoides besseyi]|nr:hypothetical protein M3Y94_01075000 [Aphelenchoides besseyi]